MCSVKELMNGVITMVYTALLWLLLCAVDSSAVLRTTISNQHIQWNVNEVPYTFGSAVGNDQRHIMEQAMREIENAVIVEESTCISFRKSEHESHHMYITNADSGLCMKTGETTPTGRQFLYIRTDCIKKRDIIGSLLVSIGHNHEHQRPDRDQYIQVHMDNVLIAARSQFEVIPPGDTDLLGLPYDFHSVTHYGPYQYAINKSLPTITTNVSGFNFDKRDTLSFYDVLKVQTLYGCPKGYTMFDKDVNRFNQTSADRYYPQWSFTSDKLRDYMNTTCDREGNYTLTALNGATWISKFPLPPGNFCVSAFICIASSSPDIKSYIQLTTKEGFDISKLNYTQPSGYWDRLNTTYTSEQEWTMLVKAHIMWGGDVLALSNMVITNGVCGM